MYGNVYAIDTGGVFADVGIKEEGKLTVANVLMKTEVLLAPRSRPRVDVGDPYGAPAVPFTRFVASEDDMEVTVPGVAR